jgi:hypothetical protein
VGHLLQVAAKVLYLGMAPQLCQDSYPSPGVGAGMRGGGTCSALCSSPLLFGALVTAQLECIPPAASPWCVGEQTCICSGWVGGGGGPCREVGAGCVGSLGVRVGWVGGETACCVRDPVCGEVMASRGQCCGGFHLQVV